MFIIIVFWLGYDGPAGLLFFVPALLLSILTPLVLPSSSVSLSYFVLAVLMCECLGKHSWMSCPISYSHADWYLFFALCLFCVVFWTVVSISFAYSIPLGSGESGGSAREMVTTDRFARGGQRQRTACVEVRCRFTFLGLGANKYVHGPDSTQNVFWANNCAPCSAFNVRCSCPSRVKWIVATMSRALALLRHMELHQFLGRSR